MNLYTIDCNEKDVEVGYEEYRHTFVIRCDDEDDNNSFNFDYYGDDEMVIDRNRCNLSVYITENKTPYPRNFTIVCRHSNDSRVSVEINIVQEAEEYKLEITSGAAITGENKYSKGFKSIVDHRYHGSDINCNYFEKGEFIINVVGGSKKYHIDSIVKYHEELEDDGRISYYNFDNGFVYTKFEDKLVIISYGRPFLDENDYYLIRMSHFDKRDLKIELRIQYTTDRSATRSASSAKKRGRKKKVVYQTSNVYLTDDKLIEIANSQNMIEEFTYDAECEIRLDKEIGDEFVVEGKEEVVLPFEVFENGGISNLMVSTNSSGYWCRVMTDSTNRKLLINITDEPMCERKAYVNIKIIDYPDVYITFILVNKPQELQVK